ncbi:MAG: aspartate/glutamate racemase family protein [Aeromonadales bacterium]|nr:aspartate/glutamate racemase family protein [Aeromonadales bacterium]
MKIALVYTGITPELQADVEREASAQIPGAQFITFKDPTIIQEAVKAGYVTKGAAARLVKMFMEANEQGADAILNICSSVGFVADACQDLAKFTGVPIVRIDEEMCREAVRLGSRIGVMATLPTTLNPTKGTVLRVAQEMDRRVTLVDALVEGGFGLDQDKFKELMLSYAKKIEDKVDVILFAQGSMAYAEKFIAEATGKKVLSSPRFGAIALRRALEMKGLV